MWRVTPRMKRAGEMPSDSYLKTATTTQLFDTRILHNILLCSSQVVSVLKEDV